ncbi:uncharacterized protein METZ01_LOCUS201891, partial [marine metagenome]|jgi:hypothetical protein
VAHLEKSGSIFFLQQSVWRVVRGLYLLTTILPNIKLLTRFDPFTWITEFNVGFPKTLNQKTVEIIPNSTQALVLFGSDIN